MHYFEFIFLAIIVISLLVLGFVALFFGRRRKSNQVFFCLTVFLAIWSVMIFPDADILSMPTLEIFLRLDYAVGVFVIYFIMLFSASFPVRKLNLSQELMLALPATALAFLFFFSDFLVNNVRVEAGRVENDFGVGYFLYLLMMVSFIGYALFNWGLTYWRIKGIEKLQVKYILLGFASCSLIVLIVDTVFQDALSMTMFRYANFSVIFIAAFSAYAMLKHHLMDIRVIIKKGLVYSFLMLLIAGVYIIILLGLNSLFDDLKRGQILWASGLSAFLLSLTLPLLQKKFDRLTDKYFFKAPVNYKAVLRELNQLIAREAGLIKLTGKMEELIKQSLKLERAEFFFCKTHANKAIRTGERCFDSFIGDSRKIIHVKKHFRNKLSKLQILLLDDLENGDNQYGLKDREMSDVIEEMKNNKFSMCMMVVGNADYVGILCIGQKLNGDPFFSNEIEWFDIFAKQIGLAIERAAMFDDMEGMVARRTDQLKKTNKRLRLANASKSEFVSIASHQLRTPLTGISWFLETLSDPETGPLNTEQKYYVDQLAQSSKRMTALVNDLLDVSRIEHGTVSFETSLINIKDSVQRIVDELSPVAQKNEIKLTFSSVKAVPKVLVDEKKISQAIMNVVDNALEYSSKGAQVEVSLDLDDSRDNILISIKDHGVGIPKKQQAHIFEKFVRGDNAKTIKTDGTGLGLYIAKTIINSFGGSIRFESKENKGTTFFITLPIKDRRREKVKGRK
jgi:signal transduction histidine kinase